MKPILLLALVCSTFLTSSAQTSDKWAITPDAKIKKGFGRLDMNFPDSIYWWIIIYDQNDKMVKSFYPNEKIKSFTLSPGLYRIELSNVKVENVPIEAGHATRLRSGQTKIESADYWQLYDASKENFFTSSSLFDGTAYRLFEASRKISKSGNHKTLNLALPVGNYQIKEGGDYRAIEVKDEIKNISKKEITETETWVITDTKELDPLTKNKGRLNTSFPVSHPGDAMQCFWQMEAWLDKPGPVYPVHFNPNTPPPNSPVLDLDTGIYKVKLNGVLLKNIPVRAGLQTRVKSGMIGMSDGYWELLDSSNHFINYSEGNHPVNSVSLPVGSYSIRYSEEVSWHIGISVLYYPVVIRDSAFINIAEYVKNALPSGSDYWVMNKIPGDSQQSGRLNLNFSQGANWNVRVFAKNEKTPVVSYSSENKPDKKNSPGEYGTLKPGKYNISLSNVLVTGVWISKGCETRIKSGIVDISFAGDWSLNYSVNAGAIGANGVPVATNTLIASGNKPQKIILPIGDYELTANGKTYYNTLKDGWTIKF